jgi:hypothetical protein
VPTERAILESTKSSDWSTSSKTVVDLVRGNGLTHLGAMKMQTLDLGADEEMLRLFAEQEHGCIAGLIPVEQVKVRQCLEQRSVGVEGISTALTGTGEKFFDTLPG